ncbi:jg20882 [Pararge aegeria aegeria]|uniref:Jg20882 protein n=1 Tax=Pararge aegeria aegeria TaxID=348720 RepID=A0A8S4QG73_9NEOP|nr:jg20882 [Pararge aegeria aegeria]
MRWHSCERRIELNFYSILFNISVIEKAVDKDLKGSAHGPPATTKKRRHRHIFCSERQRRVHIKCMKTSVNMPAVAFCGCGEWLVCEGGARTLTLAQRRVL